MSASTRNQIELARDICIYAHAGQVDKAMCPYHIHPEYVSDHVDGEVEKVVALLHDVLEDTGFPASVLEELFGQEVFEALCLLRHEPNTEYMEYIRRLSCNPIARAVKIADLEHNMQLNRLQSVDEDDLRRVAKYKAALSVLQEVKRSADIAKGIADIIP